MERRLAAILIADMVGYSRLMAADEAGTLTRQKLHRKELIDPKIVEFGGRVVKSTGDGVLAEFPSVVDALRCAVTVQLAMTKREAEVPEKDRIAYRIGMNLGDIIVEKDDIYGDGVNVAARLEALAEPGGIWVSRTVVNHVKGKVASDFEDLGEQDVKNIPEPVRVFRVLMEPEQTGEAVGELPNAKWRKRPAGAIAVAGVVLVISAVGIIVWQPWTPDVEPAAVEEMAFPLPNKPSIAVLPFTNMSGDASQEYFADGMTDDLITDLSKLSGLFVIARNSSFSYKGQQVMVRRVAEELGVRYVLEGSVRRVGAEVRINAQLIDATTGGHLWAERYDGSLKDIFAIQDQVTEQIVAALAVSLTGEEAAAQARHATENAVAHDAYLQGWAHYKHLTPESLATAVPFFEESIRFDPNYAQAHAALAAVYWEAFENDWAFDLGVPSTRAARRASEHLREALKVPTPLAYALKSRMLASSGLYEDAVAEAERAVALDPNDASALAGFANALVHAGRPDEGLELIRRAMRLDPHHPPSHLIILGSAQFGMEHYEAAAMTFVRAARRNPESELPLILLASSYGHLSSDKEADAAIEAANDLRAQAGLGDLSLEKNRHKWWSPFNGQIDFARFGGSSEQERVRLGLSGVSALTWQYLVVVHSTDADGYGAWWEVEGATEVNAATARSLHAREAVFVDVSLVQVWDNGHILSVRPETL